MENAQFPPKVEPSALDSANSTKKQASLHLTPREDRVLKALLTSPSSISREDVDRIAGASNGPAVIMALRNKVTGQLGILMQRVEVLDRDGLVARPGRYFLSTLGRTLARRALQGEG